MKQLTDDQLLEYAAKALRENMPILYQRVEWEVARRNSKPLWARLEAVCNDPANATLPGSTI